MGKIRKHGAGNKGAGLVRWGARLRRHFADMATLVWVELKDGIAKDLAAVIRAVVYLILLWLLFAIPKARLWMCKLSQWQMLGVIGLGVCVQLSGLFLILYRRGRRREEKEAARKDKAARFKTEEVGSQHDLIQMARESPAVKHWRRGDRRLAAIRDRHSTESIALARDLILRFEKEHPECCRRDEGGRLEALLDRFRGFLDLESAKLIREGKDAEDE